MAKETTTTKEKSKEKDKETNEKMLTLWQERYSKALSSQDSWFKKVSAWYDLLYAYLDDGDMEWHSRVFEPLMTSKVWNLISKIVAGDPGWLANPVGEKNEEVALKAIAAEETLKYYSNNSNLDLSLKEMFTITTLDAATAGIGYVKVPWTTKNKAYHEKNVDEYGNIDTEETRITKTVIGYPDATNLSVFDVLFAPSTGNALQKAPYIICKGYQPMSDLKQKNEDTPGYYKNLSNLSSKPGSDTTQYSLSRNRLSDQDSEHDDPTIDSVEMWECYERIGDKIYITVIGNRKTILKPKRLLDYWHGKYPIIAFRLKPKSKSLVGESLFETNERLLWGINDLTNHFLDAWNLANNPMILQEETTVVDSYEVAPGNQITYKGTQEPKPFMLPQPPVRSYSGIRDTLAADIDQNTISSYQTGAPLDSSDKTAGTKGGIQAIQAAGDDMIELYRSFFREGVKELGTMWLQLVQQYQDRSIWVQITGENGVDNAEISPEMVQGEFDVQIEENSMRPQNEELEITKTSAFTDKMLQIEQMSLQTATPIFLNHEQLVKDTAQGFNKKNTSKYLQEPPQQMMGQGEEPGLEQGLEQEPQLPPPLPEQEPQMPPPLPEQEPQMPPPLPE